MKLSRKGKGFTLIELLVVVAIIALLLSILLPSLSGAREQGKKAKCLANLGNIGKALYQYANDDKAEQVIPIHMNMVRSVPHWLWRTVNWFAWGGRSGQKPFRYQPMGSYLLTDKPMAEAGIQRPEYAAHRRPLNLYMLTDVGDGDDTKMEWFECPSDRGYPDDKGIDDSPMANCERSCYETIGNSYRASLFSFSPSGGGTSPSTGHFAMGPWGHRLSTLQDTGRLVLAGEPTWFNMIGKDDEPGITDEVPVIGWHKRKLMDNLLYCDGSARLTKAERQTEVAESDVTLMGVVQGDLIARGSTYRMDTYPVPGARIWGDWSGQDQTKWPFKGYQDNLRTQ